MKKYILALAILAQSLTIVFSQNKNELKLAPHFTHAHLPNDSILPLMKTVDGKPVWSLMNLKTGSIAPFPFEGFQVNDHTFIWQGKMVVMSNQKWGVASTTGQVVLPLEYAEIKTNPKFPWFIRADSLWGLLNNDWKVIVGPKYKQLEYISGSKIQAILPDGKWGLLDTTGTIILPFGHYTSMNGSRDGNLKILGNIKNESALFNLKSQTWVLPFGDQNISFHSGSSRQSAEVVLFSQKGKTGLADAHGVVRIEPKYDEILWADDHQAACGTAKQTDPETGERHWYFLNAKGNVTGEAPTGTIWVDRVYDGLARFKNAEKQYGYIKPDGTVAIEPIFAKTESFRLGYALVKQPDNQYSIINKNSEILNTYPFPYINFDYFLNYAAFSEDGESYGLMNRNGEIIMPITDKFIGTFEAPELANGVLFFEAPNEKKGAVKLDGTTLFKPVYDQIQYSEETGAFLLQKDGIELYADWDGKILPRKPVVSQPDGHSANIIQPNRVIHPKYGKSLLSNEEFALFRNAGQLILMSR